MTNEALYQLALSNGYTDEQIEAGEVYWISGFGDGAGNLGPVRFSRKITKPEEAEE